MKDKNLDLMIAGTTYGIDGVTYSLFDICGIDETNITEACIVQASRLAYFSSLVAKAKATHEEAKNACDAMYAEADLSIRDEYTKLGKKVTEPTIKAEVLLDEEYILSQRRVIDAKRDLDTINSLVSGLKSRGEMLVQIGADLRQERQFTDMQVKEALRERN